MLALQSLLFSAPDRKVLLNYVPKSRAQYKIQVFRNHSFELVEHTIGAYLDYAELGICFEYSGYDDSFSFSELDSSADAFLMWVDATRYGQEPAAFLRNRLDELKKMTVRPVLAIPFGVDLEAQDGQTTVWNISELEREMQGGMTDLRARAITGTPLSKTAMILVSRELGLKYLPAILRPALKAIVVDLDNTLYGGVLGEDGPDGIVLSKKYEKLQKRLHELSRQGFFICVVSKNDPEDVENLFRQREDFPLKREDITKLCASWDEKKHSIQQIADFLNIGVDSILFIDDNIGELMAAKAELPSLHLLLADHERFSVSRILDYFPGLLRLQQSQSDSLRKLDVQANEQRRVIQQALSHEEYIRSLKLNLRFTFDCLSQAQRISELANKTNQFIFNYRRYTLAEIQECMMSDTKSVAALSLSDILSDSGLIGVCVGSRENNVLIVEDCFISCRALGRGIEEIMVLQAIEFLRQRLSCQLVKVMFQRGERNEPAYQLTEKCLTDAICAPVEFRYSAPEDLLTICVEEGG